MSDYEKYIGAGDEIAPLEPAARKILAKAVEQIVEAELRDAAQGEPPTETLQPGETYQRLPHEPKYPVVDVDWQLPVHKQWAEHRQQSWFTAPFYVRANKEMIGWVPWPGSVVVWPYERAWQMDLFQPSKTKTPILDKLPSSPTWSDGPDLRPSQQKKR
jgi:hypothetical protein